ncbi:Acetyl-/propionyl-coenzyme A carboxylase alpha chain [compost metagenome]
MFKKILIANRGEIACRIIATARRLGVKTVAIYSEADAKARHVRLADEAILVGPAPARESYLDAQRIIAAAKNSGAEAIHPGYGFLSENEAFAEACERAGIVFIGPPASAIRAMGSKSAAKALMEGAGVPLTPGYHGDNQDPMFLADQARRIGFPVLIKASAGGGGKGMRRVDCAEDFGAALSSCRREAMNAFGDDHILIEKYVLSPRHIEIQVFADRFGNCVHLCERDCSVQRRHQKVIEEAPAPGMTPERRNAMGKAAVDAARAVGYVGAGTVEFIADQNGAFYFMEMNTRLQVEHPVTEMITGLDLVEWQLDVASGAALPLEQEQVSIRGHAIEARIYAEDPDDGFLPSTGRLIHLSTPSESKHVRVDTGVEQGDEITPHYDPMISKLIVWDENRQMALTRMRNSLGDFQIVGVRNNVEFLSRLVTCPSFAKAELDTSLIERETQHLFPAKEKIVAEAWLFAALAQLLSERLEAASYSGVDRDSPWRMLDNWRLNGTDIRELRLRLNEDSETVGARTSADGWELILGGNSVQVQAEFTRSGSISAKIGNRHMSATAVLSSEFTHIFLDGGYFPFVRIDPLIGSVQSEDASGDLRAFMPGRIIALLVEPGITVEKGTPLLIMEAMKMEQTLSAPASGAIKAFHCDVGDQVSAGDELIQFEVGK